MEILVDKLHLVDKDNVLSINLILLFSENEKKLLVELICNEQTHMIIKDHTNYDTDKYKELEALKIKIKDM